MKKKQKYISAIIIAILIIASYLMSQGKDVKQESGPTAGHIEQNSGSDTDKKEEDSDTGDRSPIQEEGNYTSKDEVAAYLNEYKHLPDNFIRKNEAKKLGWVSNKGNLGEVAPGKSIGGDKFGNYEGTLPEANGRKYYECDIDSDGSYRGAKRIIYSSDGLIYYTEDHYKTFDLLYGEE